MSTNRSGKMIEPLQITRGPVVHAGDHNGTIVFTGEAKREQRQKGQVT